MSRAKTGSVFSEETSITFVILPSSLTWMAERMEDAALYKGMRFSSKESPLSPESCTVSTISARRNGLPFMPRPIIRPRPSSTSKLFRPVMIILKAVLDGEVAISRILQDADEDEGTIFQSRFSLSATCSAMVRDLMISISAWIELSLPGMSSSLSPIFVSSFLTLMVDED